MIKPSYRVPSMEEISDVPWNGFNAVSTFSGCGGSSLGYKMAGFRILWANEFVPAAQEVYRLNHPDTILDTRDIRQIAPADILDSIGMEPGQLDLFDGSPPCASFSTTGKRESSWGKVKEYSDTRQRVDDLFFEYVRLVNGVRPKVFVAENVSGLVKGVAKGYFLEILSALKNCGYDVKAKLLDARYLGVPQMRQRIIFVGVRQDLEIRPEFPRPSAIQYTLRDAFHGESVEPIEPNSYYNSYYIGEAWDQCGYGKQHEKHINMIRPSFDRVCNTITQTTGSRRDGGISACVVSHPTQRRSFSIAELKRICAFPDDFQLTGTYSQQWERLGRAVPPVMMSHIAATIRDEVLCT